MQKALKQKLHKVSVSVNKNIQGPTSVLKSSTFATRMPGIRTRQQEPFPALYLDIVCAFLCKAPFPDCSVIKSMANLGKQPKTNNTHTKCKANQPT